MSPQEAINDRIRQSQRFDALTAAAILKFAPETIGDEEVGSWLRRIGSATLRKDVAEGWLQRAGVNPWRPGSKLSIRQRMLLIGCLREFTETA